MTDRELLEMAAKAAGYDPSHPWNAARMTFDPPVIGLAIDGVSTCWNPLENDGDALRLAVKLRLLVDVPSRTAEPLINVLAPKVADVYEPIGTDLYGATRRAIVRAAAEIAAAPVNNKLRTSEQ